MIRLPYSQVGKAGEGQEEQDEKVEGQCFEDIVHRGNQLLWDGEQLGGQGGRRHLWSGSESSHVKVN